jgi:uncharacterized membrane protein
MIDINNFSSFFELVAGINIGSSGLIAFFDNESNTLKEQLTGIRTTTAAARVHLDSRAINTRPNTAVGNFIHATKWLAKWLFIHLLRFLIGLLVGPRAKFEKNENYHLKKYLVPMLHAGIFCIVMLFLSGLTKEYTDSNSTHTVNVFIIILIICSLSYYLVSFCTFHLLNRNNRRVVHLVFLNIFFVNTLMFLSYYYVNYIDVEWLHASLKDNNFILPIFIFFCGLFPLIYLLASFIFFLLGSVIALIVDRYYDKKGIRNMENKFA